MSLEGADPVSRKRRTQRLVCGEAHAGKASYAYKDHV